MGQFFASRVVRAVFSVLIGVALLGGAFYGGRVYQNNEDQSLFTAYSPPTPGGLGGGGASASGAALGAGAGGGFGGSGSGTGANAQVNAALAVGNVPPVSTPDPNSGGYIASSNTTAASGGAGGRRRRGVFGQFVSLANGTLTIQSFLGSQSYPTSSDLSYYRVVATHQVAVGDRVAIGTDSSGAVQSVTISPNGLPYISVRAFGGGGFGGGGQGAAGGAGGGFGSGGASAGGGFGSGGASAGGASTGGGGGFGGGTTVLTGTVVTATGGALTIKTVTGMTQVVPLTSATALYQVQSATASAFKAGATVAARTTSLNGQTAVSAIVAVAATGALATFAS